MARNNGTKGGAGGAALAERPVEEPTSHIEAVIEPAEEGYRPTKMRPGESMAEAGRGILHTQLQKLHKAEPVAREGSDPEGVHDMRVATRRLRAALKVLEESVYDRKKAARFRKELRELANALGATRDADVFLEHLEKHTATLPPEEQKGLEPLRQELLHRREGSRKAMLKTLDKPKTAKLLHKLETFVTTPGAGVAAPESSDPNEAHPNLVRHFAGSAVWRSYEEVLAYETVVGPETPVAVLHRLRVACKRLRYTLEFFQDALPAGVKTLQKNLVEVQDDLGAMHDSQVAAELSQSLLHDQPHDEALHTYGRYRAAEIDSLKTSFLLKWQALIGHAYKRQLATALAGMGAS